MLDDLAASGFKIGADQRLRALAVFLAMVVSAGVARSAGRIASLLGPILCHSADEQRAFGRIATTWFSPDARAGSGVAAPAKRDATDEAESKARRARFRRYALIAVAILVGLVVVAFVLGHVPHVPRPATDGALSGTGGGKSPVHDTAANASAANTAARVLGSVTSAFGPVGWMLWLIPLGVIGIVVIAFRATAAYARQVPVASRASLRRLLLAGSSRLEPRRDFFRMVQPLRRQVEMASAELDVDATIEQTIAAGGMPVPVFAKRRVSPEYIVLLDKRGTDDHAARHCEALVHALELAGVSLLIYHFDSDPRRVIPARDGRALDLGEVVFASESRRLIVFSDGAGLLDDRLGSPHPWTEMFAEWADPVLLTWRDPRDWSRRESTLEMKLGFMVLPASEDGVVIAAQRFQLDRMPTLATQRGARRVVPDPGRLDGLLAPGTWRGMESAAPRRAESNELVRRLRAELSAAAFDWLCAVALYPGIYWSLTVYLGTHVIRERYDERTAKSALLEIVRLPWLRYGRMPAWLRTCLIDAMPAALRATVESALRTMLSTSVSGVAKDVAMDVVVGAPETTAIDAAERLEDAVMIDVMARRRAAATDFRLPTLVSRSLGLGETIGARPVWRALPIIFAIAAFAVVLLRLVGWSVFAWPGDPEWATANAGPFAITIAYVPSARRAASGVRVHDRIDVRTVSLTERLRILNGMVANRPLQLHVARNGRVVTLTVLPVPVPMRWGDWERLMGELAMVCVAALIAWRGPMTTERRLLSVTLSAYAAAETSFYLTTPWPAVDLVALALSSFGVLGAVSMSSLVLLNQQFGRRPFVARRFVDAAALVAIALQSLYGIAAPIAIATAWFDPVAIFFGPWQWIAFGTAITVFGSGVCAMAASSHVERRRLAPVFAPIGALLLANALDNFFSVTAPGFEPVTLAGLNLVTLGAPIVLAYAVLRGHLLDVAIVNRALAYALTALICVVATALAQWAAIGWLEPSRGFVPTVVSVIFVLAGGIAFFILPRRIERVLERVFFPGRRERVRMLARFVAEAAFMSDAAALLERTALLVMSQSDASGVAILTRQAYGVYRSVYEIGLTMPLLSDDDPAVIALRATLQPVELRRSRSALPGAHAFPMASRGILMGILVCGPKSDDRPYSSDERDAFAWLTRSVGDLLATRLDEPPGEGVSFADDPESTSPAASPHRR